MSTLKVNTIQDTTGNDALTIDSSGNVTASQGFIPSTQLSHRNLIINGAMQVWQRGTSFTSTSGFMADRFYHSVSGGTISSISQQTLPLGQTDLPSQFRTFLRYDMSAGNNNAGVFQKIENVDCVEGEVTFSVYAKGTNPTGGKFTFNYQQNFGSGGSSTVNVQDVADIVVTSSWQRFTVTFTIPSLSGKTKGTGSYLYIWIAQPNGDTGTDAFTLDTTGWQLEVGSVATPFEHRSYGEELARCQRYYQIFDVLKLTTSDSGGSNRTDHYISKMLPVKMRTAPSYTYASETDHDSSGTTMDTFFGDSEQITHFRTNAAISRYRFTIDDFELDAEL